MFREGIRRWSPVLTAVLVGIAMIAAISLAGASYATDPGGKDGNITWSFSPSSKTLTVGVEDKTSPNCSLSYTALPWDKYKSDIQKVIVKDGVTDVTGATFKWYPELQEIELPASVTAIRESAFMEDLMLESLKHPTGNCEVSGGMDDMGVYYGPFDHCNDALLVFDVPGDSELADWCRGAGFMIKGEKGSLRGATVIEYHEGDEPMFEEPEDGYSYCARAKWTGKAVKPVPEVRLYGRTLTYGEDFTCTWSKNTNVGRHEVIINGIGDYYDSTHSFFVIYPKSTSITKVTGTKKAMTVKWLKQARKMSKKHISGYEVQIAKNKSFTKSQKTYFVKGYKKTSKTIKKLKAGTYYVRVRTCMDGGEPIYINSGWSPKKKVKVK